MVVWAVVSYRGLLRAVEGWRELSWAVGDCWRLLETIVGCRKLRAVESCHGLLRAVEGCQGLSKAVRGCRRLSEAGGS